MLLLMCLLASWETAQLYGRDPLFFLFLFIDIVFAVAVCASLFGGTLFDLVSGRSVALCLRCSC